ncbi:MAG: biotin transporter BioY [Candidatus Limnocylindrales bacterium]
MVAGSRMLRVPPFERGLTLADFFFPIRVGERISSRLRHIALILGGAALITAGAWISFQVPAVTLPFGIYVPANPYVPITLQTFGVFVSGAALGVRRGTAASLLYLVLGIVGLPVFAADPATGIHPTGLARIIGVSGGHVVLGSTGGYLIGFVLAAAVVGRLAELGWDRTVRGALAAMLIGELVIVGLGLIWLAAAIPAPLDVAAGYGLWPFLPTDLLKILAATGALPFGWWLVNRRPSDR